MKRLLLLRHAKTAQDSGEGDHARALTERGRGDASLIGRYMDTHGYWPDTVLCSTSVRTLQTWELLRHELARAPQADFLKILYLATPRKILSALRNVPDDTRATLIVGHNPGTQELAVSLARQPLSSAEAEKLERMTEKYSTGTLSVFDFDVTSWRDLAPGKGILLEFVKPKDLRG